VFFSSGAPQEDLWRAATSKGEKDIRKSMTLCLHRGALSVFLSRAHSFPATSLAVGSSLQNNVLTKSVSGRNGVVDLNNLNRHFHSSAKACGGPRPWKKRGMPVAIHASQRPAEIADIDFSGLGLKYPAKYTPASIIPRTKWTPPPTPAADGSLPTDGLPFVVDRTTVSRSLPVYTDFKAGGTKVVTILRKCRGDVKILKDEMEKVVGKEVIVRPGKLVVDGNFSSRLKSWLVGLGF